MAMQVIETQTLDKDKNELKNTCNFDFGDNLAAAVATHTEDVVFAQYVASVRIGLQNYVRGLLKQGKNEKEIQEGVNTWRPGIKAPGKSKIEKTKNLLAQLSDEDKAKLLADIQASLSKPAATKGKKAA